MKSSLLNKKKVLIGVTAGIAAYKTAALVRLFIKAGAEVRVLMTPTAKDFVTPLTLSTLSKNPVLTEFYSDEDHGAVWNNHVELGLWADLFLIAPATANTLSKMASGASDNLVLATYLSAKCKVYFAPAMDLDMYQHPSTHHSFEQLTAYGNIMIPAGEGELASGLSGKGRMAEPEVIIDYIEKDIARNLPLRSKKVLITAGPTYEAIDPVRFIGNYSSGKMGIELAKTAGDLGASVDLILGPGSHQINHPLVKIHHVVTAQQMFETVQELYTQTDIAIAAAAVADYRPKNVASQKIKKKTDTLFLELEKTTDILKWMGTQKKSQLLIGFALETQNELENAKRKLQHKNLNWIVLNSLNDEGAGFQKSTNKITLINHKLEVQTFPLKTKKEVAEDIFSVIQKEIYA